MRCVRVATISTLRSSSCLLVTAAFKSGVMKSTHMWKEARYSRLGMDGFTDITYNTTADTFLEHVDNILEEINSETIEDVNLSSGVLTIETTLKGTFVLNKQAPNLQLWLSSPISGPHHYDMFLPKGKEEGKEYTLEDMKDVRWLADSDGHSLKLRLEEELTEALGVEVKL